ncbi:phosphomannomutase [Aquimarina sp. EL_43]|uniref:phospho-sugar mutase n=1 Tax=unclassified Aquimarina TaxID=2627091 RepID=UPI0018C9B133|nr:MULTISPECIES: phospho-sugar mutase [unclassified Aquimarina]MBG6129299.1 phosphomannomutase [Aquimarina sp. EL_35]MBG6150364.1 phosphomannomutase [Aquimarina sp. EL_32]MBG6166950.1 phosphomannomutase [Aquimarina sp. EL_43]
MQITDSVINLRVDEWLTPVFDTATQKEIKNLQDTNSEELKESFYKDLEFGTGGMRGIMGVGTNRINKYTLGKSTQGLSNYLIKQFAGEQPKAVIAYDCRHNSDTLAQVVADVFSANGVKVYLFSSLRPTPELSFAVRELGCHCGIVLTASHNPPEYNGYKVYWQDGGQLVPPQDGEIISEINALKYSDIQFDTNPSLIQKIDQEIDTVFIEQSVKNGSFAATQKAKDNTTIVFTSLHGTSITAVPETLEKAGYKNVHIVQEQAEPDGNFPTVKSPNPEEPEALTMAMELAAKVDADIVIGTDPDCDRLGIAVRNDQGELQLLNGNQTMIVMTWFLLENYKKQGFTGNEFIASTIVSTPMMQSLAQAYSVEYKEVLTGFKWIAKLIKDFPEQHFIGGGEESFGFMVGDFVRDKDAVTSTLLACEIVAFTKANGSSFYSTLLDLYTKHGFYKEHLVSLVKKGIDGAAEIKQTMVDLRNNPPESLNEEKVVLIEDYQTGIAKNIQDHTEYSIDIPKSNVLIFYTEAGSKIAARPSGTEPKIKFYISVQESLHTSADFTTVQQQLDGKIEAIKKDLQLT